jgi:hypothetical protein
MVQELEAKGIKVERITMPAPSPCVYAAGGHPPPNARIATVTDLA